jgi:hypothetical protein
MAPSARHALGLIRGCIGADRFILTAHFSKRMDLRGLVWADVLATLDDPADVRPGGDDEHGRPKWLIAGAAADGLDLEVVCVLDKDDQGHRTVFVTIYWE